MKRYLLSLFVLCLAASMAAQQSKLSAWLWQAVADHQYQRRAANSQEMLTTVFVECDETVTDEQLAQYGGRCYARLDDIAVITLPLSQVGALAGLTAVRRIEANRLAQPTMDRVAADVNILPVYQPAPTRQAYTGQGVVVGVMDIGFDLTHPNFYDGAALSNYRIKAFWDQLHPATDVARFPVGRDFVTAADILAQGCATDGHDQLHGTHTVGIAAGSGYDSPYRGVAYGSDLCLVANAVTADTAFIAPENYYLYTSATDALGFKYLFDYAKAQGKPCVASFSEGYTPYMDGDDQLFSRFLSRLIGPGRILVASAGNENQAQTYVAKPRGTSEAGAFIRVYRPAARYRIQTDGAVSLSLLSYAGKEPLSKQFSLPGSSEAWDKDIADTLFVNGDTCAVRISRYPSAFSAAATIYQLELTANRPINELPHTALVLTGSESHAEMFGSSTYTFTSRDTDPRWNAAAYGHNIFAPGCFEGPITVGSTSHRMALTNVNGALLEDKTDTEGRLSWFSSTGPTLDGRIKPDVTAPGNYVVSSLSSYYHESHPNERYWDVSYFDALGRTYVWGANNGTSMSAPVVAGIIALWLEAKPDLTRDDIAGILQRTCRKPETAIDYPNVRYGYGEIDAYAGLLDILGLTAVEGISHHQPGSCRLWAQDGQLNLSFDQLPTSPINISIFTAGGVLVHQQQLTPAGSRHAMPLPVMPSGIYAVQLTSKDQHLTGSQLIRINAPRR